MNIYKKFILSFFNTLHRSYKEPLIDECVLDYIFQQFSFDSILSCATTMQDEDGGFTFITLAERLLEKEIYNLADHYDYEYGDYIYVHVDRKNYTITHTVSKGKEEKIPKSLLNLVHVFLYRENDKLKEHVKINGS